MTLRNVTLGTHNDMEKWKESRSRKLPSKMLEISMIVLSLFWECISGICHCYRSCLLAKKYQNNLVH